MTTETTPFGFDTRLDEAVEDVSVEEIVQDDDVPDDTGESNDKATTGKKATRSAGTDKALVRRVAAKAASLVDADPMARSLAAQILGVNDEIVDLTVAVMTADRSAQQVLGDIKSLTDAGTEAMVAVAYMTMPKPRAKAAWQVLATLDVVAKNAPANDAKAALALAEGVRKVTTEQSDLLDTAADLLKKWA